MNNSREFSLHRQQRLEVWADFVDLAIHEFVDRLGSPKLQRLVEDGLSLGNGQPRGDIENGWNEGRAHAETAEAQANQQDERAGRITNPQRKRGTDQYRKTTLAGAF